MTAPLLQQTLPADNSTGVSVTANLALVFNEAVKANSGIIRIYTSDGTLFHSIAVTDTSQVTFLPTRPNNVLINPNVDLLSGTGYYVLVDAGAIENLAGDDFGGIASSTQLNFTTAGSPPPGGDTTAPLLTGTSPLDNATGVAIGANLVLTFDEAVKAGTGNIEIHNASDGSIAKSIAVTDATQITFSGNQLTINPTTDLVAGADYYVTLASGVVRDLANNNFAGISSATAFNFTTVGGGADTTAPLLTGTSPLDNATGIAVGANLSLTFDEAVKAGTGNIEIHNVSDGSIAKSIAVTDATQITFSGNQLTINPTTDLAAGAGYYVTLASGVVRDLANNDFAGISSATAFDFTTAGGGADTTAPLLTGTSPLDNATGIAVGANLILTFDEAVKAGAGNIEIRNASNGTIAKTIAITDASQVSFSGNQLTVNPTTDLVAGTGYYVTLASGVVRDLANNNFAGISSATAFNFTTVAAGGRGDTTAPLLTGTSPLDDASGVAVGTNLVLTFNESVKAGVGNIEIHNVSDDSIAKSIAVTDATQITFSGNQLTINPTTDLAAGAGYYVTLASGVVRDLANNNFAGISSTTAFNFTTVVPDTDPPFLFGTTPFDNATGVAVGTNLVLTFNEAVQAGAGNIVIRNVVGGTIARIIPVTDTSQVSFSGNQMTINPTTDLAENHAYYVTLSTGAVRDLAGNNYPGFSLPDTFNFTTAGTADTTGPILTNTSPLDNATNVSSASNIVLTFNEAVQASTGYIFIRLSSNGSFVDSIPITDTSRVTFSGNQMTIDPWFDLAEGVGYYVNINPGVVVDLAHNAFQGLTSSTALNFVTADAIAPVLVNALPSEDDPTVAASTNLSLMFSETVKAGNGNIEIRDASDGSVVQSIAITDGSQVTFAGNQVTINPASDLLEGVTFYVTLGSGVVLDLANNPFAGISSPTDFTFTVPHFIIGTEGNDSLNGVSGFNDTLNGLVGKDTLSGGDGDDTYIIRNYEGGETSILLYHYIADGGGWSILPTPDQIEWELYDYTGDGLVDYVKAAYEGEGYWRFEFSTTQLGTNLVPGTYLNAQRASLASPGHAGIDVYGWGWSTAQTGNFTINNIVIDYSGFAPVLVSLSVTFEEESGIGYPLYGTINYNYAPAGPATVDEIVEEPGEGIDTVRSWINFALPDNVENLILMPYTAISGTGNALDNVITGNNSENILDGGSGADTMVGGGSSDTYVVDNNADAIVEEGSLYQYIDTALSSASDYTLPANVENLILVGSSNIDGSGNELNNVLTGNAGVNVLSGGAGDDFYKLGAGDSVVENADAGSDTVETAVTYTLDANVENLTLTGWNDVNGTGNGLDNVLKGSLGDNTLGGGNGNDTLIGGIGLDTLIGGLGDDLYVIRNYEGGETSIVVQSEQEDWSYWLNGGSTLSLPFSDYEIVADVDDATDDGIVDTVRFTYYDFHHSWTLEFSTAGLGINLVPGTYVDDTSEYSYDTAYLAVWGNSTGALGLGNFTVVEAAFDYSGPSPTIASLSIRFEQFSPDPYRTPIYGIVNYNYGPGGTPTPDTMIENDGEGTDTVKTGMSYVLPANFENLILTDSYDLTGTGNAVANFITGNTGDNLLDGKAGADTMAGGSGHDTYIVDDIGDHIVESYSPEGGFDTVQSSVTHTLDDLVEKLILTGSADINGTGNTLNNILIGNAGTNVLSGGNGDDTYHIDSLADSIVENLYEGNDTVVSSLSYTLGNNVDNLTLTGSGNLNGTGNTLDNVLIGTEKFPGAGGQNALNGGDGNDTLDGRSGLDTLIGGLGNDTYVIDNYEGGQTSILLQGEPGNYVGNGEVISLNDADSFEITLLDQSGDGLVDFLQIQYDDDLHYWVLKFSTAELGTNLAVGTYVEESDPLVVDIYGDGRSASNSLGSFTVSAINIDYSGGTPVLMSAAITFEQYPLPEAASLYGEVNYNYAAAGPAVFDTIIENAGGGMDSVKAAVSYTLGANLENLTLTGYNLALTATGNALDNLLVGNSGVNVLIGLGGDDTLMGGGGPDTYKIGADDGSDTITNFFFHPFPDVLPDYGDVVVLDGFALGSFEAAQAAMTQDGSNTILDLGNGETLTFLGAQKSSFIALNFEFVNVQAPSGPQPFTLPVSGAYINTINGGFGADNLTGTSANNRLDGKTGNDTMAGLGGDDTYLVNASGDVVVETASNGIDTVISSAASYTLPSNVENLTLSGAVNHAATGNSLDNLIIASSRPDTINGGAGTDIIQAGTGACVLTGGAGNDMFVFPVIGSQKTITDFHVGEDLVDLRGLLASYGGSDPIGDGLIVLTTVAGGMRISVDPTLSGTKQNLVTLTGVAVGDVNVGTDILY
jgi:methionine-rich copper-binding protein CopC/Ca2+-binding RTX toxin-like protein